MIKWYEFVQEQANGDRWYKLQALPPKGEVHSVISFVQDAPKICFKSYEKGRYKLSRKTHEQLLGKVLEDSDRPSRIRNLSNRALEALDMSSD